MRFDAVLSENMGVYFHVFVTDYKMTVRAFEAIDAESPTIDDDDVRELLHTHESEYTNASKTFFGKLVASSALPNCRASGIYACIGSSVLSLEQSGKHEVEGRETWMLTLDIYTGKLSAFVNSTSMYSTLKRKNAMRSILNVNGRTVMFVYRPFYDEGLLSDSAYISMFVDPNYGYGSNVQITNELTPEEDRKESHNAFPRVRLALMDSVTQDGAYQIGVKMLERYSDAIVPKDVTMFIESDAGYLPKKRVALNNGIGQFLIYPLYLSKGDKMKVKIGWRYYTGEDELIIEV